MMPLFGRTQYLRGAVVLTLKHTFLSVGLVSFRVAVTTSVNGPEEDTEKNSTVTREHVCKLADLSCSLCGLYAGAWLGLHVENQNLVDTQRFHQDSFDNEHTHIVCLQG